MKIKQFVSVLILFGCGIFQDGFSQKITPNTYPFQPVPFTNVKIEDRFWEPRINTNREITIPYAFKKCEETGRIDNFAFAGGKKEGKFVGFDYNDSDLYKVIEGASYSLQQHYDRKLDSYLDSIIDIIASAQEEDGYLYTARTIDPQNPAAGGDQRWSDISNELYDVGHMYEAAVAHYMATNKKTLLNVAVKNANLVCNIFGPGKVRLVPGHQEIEIGLVKLYNITGNKKYLDTAKFFINERGNAKGHKLFKDGDNIFYSQDHIPVVNQTKAVGHAVRAGYFYCGIADVAAITKDTSYIHAIDRLWESVINSKLYLTGGIGSRHAGEAFGEDFELPNESAYNETCAAVANCLWNYRMFLLHGQSKYFDVLERTLYNGFLSGISLDGDKFFYPNALLCKSDCQRSPWFDCACCPTNISRFMPSLPGYIYAQKGSDVYVNLYIGNTTELEVDKNKVGIIQETEYPWQGQVKMTINPGKEQNFKLFVRIPGWAQNRPVPSDLYAFSDNKTPAPVSIKVNGKETNYPSQNGYAVIERNWKNGDQVEINLPMETRRIAANPKVEADRGLEAYQRGPVVYCFEGVDNNGNAMNVVVTDKDNITYTFAPELLNGVGTLQFKGQQVWKDGTGKETVKKTILTAIPYYAWAHRGESSMTVWVPEYKERKR